MRNHHPFPTQVRESNKVEEVSFINEMGALDMQFDLKRRLNEMEARIDDARARRASTRR